MEIPNMLTPYFLREKLCGSVQSTKHLGRAQRITAVMAAPIAETD
jgi:hypothetical protein